MKRIFSLFVVVLIILFLSVYMGRFYTYYYDNKSIMTNEAIERFERDIDEGKDISLEDYLVEEKNYNNRASRFGLKLSNIIEVNFNKVLKYFLRYLNNVNWLFCYFIV